MDSLDIDAYLYNLGQKPINMMFSTILLQLRGSFSFIPRNSNIRLDSYLLHFFILRYQGGPIHYRVPGQVRDRLLVEWKAVTHEVEEYEKNYEEIGGINLSKVTLPFTPRNSIIRIASSVFHFPTLRYRKIPMHQRIPGQLCDR